MITREDLLAAGYRRYSASDGYGDALFQKSIWRGDTKLYSIDFCEYDFTKYKDRMPSEDPLIHFEPRGQFNTLDDRCFNITMIIGSTMTIAQVEEFFARIFWSMDCRPYEGRIHPLTRIAAQGEAS